VIKLCEPLFYQA